MSRTHFYTVNGYKYNMGTVDLRGYVESLRKMPIVLKNNDNIQEYTNSYGNIDYECYESTHSNSYNPFRHNEEITFKSLV